MGRWYTEPVDPSPLERRGGARRRVAPDVSAWLVHAVAGRGEDRAGPGLEQGREAHLCWAADAHGVPGFALRQARCQRRPDRLLLPHLGRGRLAGLRAAG